MGDDDKCGKEMCSSGFSRVLPDNKDQVDRREVMIIQPMIEETHSQGSVPMVSLIALSNEASFLLATTMGGITRSTGRTHEIQAVLSDEADVRRQVMRRRFALGVMLVLLVAVAVLVPMRIVTLKK
jgi:hypothetical protein